MKQRDISAFFGRTPSNTKAAPVKPLQQGQSNDTKEHGVTSKRSVRVLVWLAIGRQHSCVTALLLTPAEART